MLQNIKTDIIYYKTDTDFEMEFNLCGCCRMRLLTDKATDKKLLISNLSRAVSRSRIIIVVGSLFGEDSIIASIAQAIGKKLSLVDNSTYGINSDEEIEVIKDAIPLVTEDGIFGGCIIESGPQTMIFLSHSKNVRKPIMNTLIHPYIKDIYDSELNNSTDKEEGINVLPETEPAEETVLDTEEITEDFADAVTDTEIDEIDVSEDTEDDDIIIAEQSPLILEDTEPEDNIILDEAEEDTEENEQEIELYAEDSGISKKELRRNNRTFDDAYFSFDNSGIISDEEDLEVPYYYKPFFTRILLIAIVVCLAFLAVLGYCIINIPTKEGVSVVAYIKEIIDTLFG